MEKRIEVKPKFLLVTDNESVMTQEFDDEKELRKQALEDAEKGYYVVAYKIASRSKVSSHPALDLRWK